jgi:uncharacterized membrane protein YccF (DUF307 family)
MSYDLFTFLFDPLAIAVFKLVMLELFPLGMAVWCAEYRPMSFTTMVRK